MLISALSTVQKGASSQRAGFEPARAKPIGFQVQLLNHSDIAAREQYLPSLRQHSFKTIRFCKLLLRVMFFIRRAGFEPARAKPIGFQVQLLNHSDIAAP
ncbi:unnamed protein product [Cercopithifilaria johnstoni]|uniref:Uncharacterized protein n=1 Tax=Cercopithifilaria johnstoni TaxID=2874296 RepID=A0A8J2M0V8_9BILA|nr:unnamed protein product [Cercopithifilaria johnstoni]